MNAFDALAKADEAAAISALGRDVTYQSAGGGLKKIRALVDSEYDEVADGSNAVGVMRDRLSVHVRQIDVVPGEGDLIVIDDVVYEVEVPIPDVYGTTRCVVRRYASI